MNGKGCQLLVSPCGVPPSLCMMTGHQPPSIRMPLHGGASPHGADLSSSTGMDRARGGAAHSAASGKQPGLGGNAAGFPVLSLRRQLLSTAGRQTCLSSASPCHQPPAALQPPSSNAVTTTAIQTRLQGFSESFKGNASVIIQDN